VFQETGFFTATFYPIQDRFDETTDPGTYRNDHPGKAPQPKTTLPDHALRAGGFEEGKGSILCAETLTLADRGDFHVPCISRAKDGRSW
jgi:hypothetical protein